MFTSPFYYKLLPLFQHQVIGLSQQVLIVFGSRHGSSAEISQEIAKELAQQHLPTDVVDLRVIPPQKWPSVKHYDGILAGSGIQITRWTNEPKQFLEEHREQLNRKEKVLGLFVSCASFLLNPEKSRVDYCEKVAEEIGVHPSLCEVFGPVMDFSDSSTLDSLSESMLKTAAKGIIAEGTFFVNFEGRNDFRDWKRIRNFAKEFATLLTNC
ncbi:MAG: hypothetical protein GF308_16955 [Candidatus Heimdallarchaeota archaeon]|nr:hypothetical protein [Candidatus Heimdallarchaeota archaeon]